MTFEKERVVERAAPDATHSDRENVSPLIASIEINGRLADVGYAILSLRTLQRLETLLFKAPDSEWAIESISLSIRDMQYDLEIEDAPSRQMPALPPADAHAQFVMAVANLKLASTSAAAIDSGDDLAMCFADLLEEACTLAALFDEQSADELLELAVSDGQFLQSLIPTDAKYPCSQSLLATLGSLWGTKITTSSRQD